MKNRILLYFSMVCFYSGFAQGFTVSADKQKIMIGEQLHLKLESDFPPGMNLSWFQIDSIPHFEVIDKSPVDTLQKDGMTRLSQQFILTSWDSGKWNIPSLALAGNRSAPIPVEVVFSSPFDPNQPYHDIKDILDVKKPIESKWYWYLIFALVLILLFLLFFPKTKKKDVHGFQPDTGAYKTAMDQLQQLQSKNAGDPKQFYTELIQIFRTYLHRRKNIQSFSKTTDDLAIQLKSLEMDEKNYPLLLQTLRLSDLVKFARFIPAEKDQEQSLSVIRESITHIEQVPHAV